MARPLSIYPNFDGRLEIFCLGRNISDGATAMWHLWQTAPSNGWSAGWSSLDTTPGAQPPAPPAVARNADGRMELFMVGGDGALWHQWQTAPSAGWSQNWSPFPRPPVGLIGSPAVAFNTDGRLEVVVAGNDGTLWHLWQTAPNSGWSDSWGSLGSPPGVQLARFPTVVHNADGRLEIFAVGSDSAVWHQWQTAASRGWSHNWAPFARPPVGLIGSPAVAGNTDGRLELVVTGSDGALWHRWQTAPNAGWSGWSPSGGPPGCELLGSWKD